MSLISPHRVSELAETNTALYRQNCPTDTASHRRTVGNSDVRQHVVAESEAPVSLSLSSVVAELN